METPSLCLQVLSSQFASVRQSENIKILCYKKYYIIVIVNFTVYNMCLLTLLVLFLYLI